MDRPACQGRQYPQPGQSRYPSRERYGLSRLILLMLKPSNVSARLLERITGTVNGAHAMHYQKRERERERLASFVKGNRTAQGEQRHVSFRLIGAAFADDPVEDDFSLGDRTPIPDDEPTPTEVVLSSEVKQSRSWRKERNAKTREALRFIARRNRRGYGVRARISSPSPGQPRCSNSMPIIGLGIGYMSLLGITWQI